MAEAPIQTVFGNLVLARDAGDAWAVFRLRCRSYRSEPRRKQRALVDGLESVLRGGEGRLPDPARVPQRGTPGSTCASCRRGRARRAHVDLWRAYLESQREQLERLDCWTPAVFVCVRLAAPEIDLQGRAARLFERTPARGVARAARAPADPRGDGRLIATALAAIWERARVATERVKSCLDAQPARADEVQWLIRRAFCRGLGEPRSRGWTRRRRSPTPTTRVR